MREQGKVYSHVLDRPCNQLGICPSTQLFCIPTVWVGKVTRLTGAYCRSSACNVKMGCKKEKSATHLGEQQPEAGPVALGKPLQIPTLPIAPLALLHLLVDLHHLGYKKCGSLVLVFGSFIPGSGRRGCNKSPASTKSAMFSICRSIAAVTYRVYF